MAGRGKAAQGLPILPSTSDWTAVSWLDGEEMEAERDDSAPVMVYRRLNKVSPLDVGTPILLSRSDWTVWIWFAIADWAELIWFENNAITS